MVRQCTVCGDDASEFILAELETEGPLTGEQRLWEDYGYLCEEHIRDAEETEWEIVERGPPDYEPTECEHCGYQWDYTGELEKTTCPSCQQKTPVENSAEASKE